MKNTDHVNWFTVKVYLLGSRSTIINLRSSAICLSAIADLAWTPSSRQERPGDKASWLQSSKWRFFKHISVEKMGDRLKQIREKSKLRRQLLAQQVRNTYSDIMRQQMNIWQCLNEYYSAISCTNLQILSYFFKEYFIVKHVITWKVKTGQ